MSWFVEFSEKAENLLNNIDKNAAKAFNKRSNVKTSYPDDTSSFLDSSAVISEDDVSENQTNGVPFSKTSRIPSTRDLSIDGTEYQLGSTSVEKNSFNDYLRSEMLQNEIHSLNNEISLLLNRVKLEEQRSRDLSAKLNISEEKNVKLEEQLAELKLKRFPNDGISALDAFHFTERDESSSKRAATVDESGEGNVHEHYDEQIRELLQEKNTLRETLREKEDEIILLKSRLSQKTYCFSTDELQSRLRALTITLVEKQSAMENLMLEKNNLLSKLNHLQKRYDEALGILHQSRINMNDTDDVKALIPVYGTNGSVREYFEKLVSFLMSLGDRNRGLSPWKLSLIIYIIFMHGLVFLLLYSNTPESTDSQTKN